MVMGKPSTLQDENGLASPCARALGHGGRGRRAVPHTWESEMGEDPLKDGWVVDRGEELHPP